MNQEQFEKMRDGRGFIAALDQSGGSTPKALKNYGIGEDAYSNDEEMFRVVHEMRSRIITSPAFNGDRILAAILFENTMDREIEGRPSGDYLWKAKNVVPIIKIDKGLADEADGVQVMKPMPGLDDLLKRAVDKGFFGTKERSFIAEGTDKGVKASCRSSSPKSASRRRTRPRPRRCSRSSFSPASKRGPATST